MKAERFIWRIATGVAVHLFGLFDKGKHTVTFSALKEPIKYISLSF
jgi:hypothetical protein